jgi:hypothetical protein
LDLKLIRRLFDCAALWYHGPTRIRTICNNVLYIVCESKSASQTCRKVFVKINKLFADFAHCKKLCTQFCRKFFASKLGINNDRSMNIHMCICRYCRKFSSNQLFLLNSSIDRREVNMYLQHYKSLTRL